MNKALWCSALALGLLGSGAALSQTPPAPEQAPAQAQRQHFPAQPQTQGQTTAPDHTVPAPPHAQPQAPIADQAKPAAVGPAQADTASGGAPLFGATPQMTPSTMSAANAELDKKPIVALQFPLTDEQKKAIGSELADAKPQNSPELAKVQIPGYLPIGATLQEFAPDLTQKVPGLSRYKFVKADKRVLIVDPPNFTVISAIPQSSPATTGTASP